jgi:hypothetical protein
MVSFALIHLRKKNCIRPLEQNQPIRIKILIDLFKAL